MNEEQLEYLKTEVQDLINQIIIRAMKLDKREIFSTIGVALGKDNPVIAQSIAAYYLEQEVLKLIKEKEEQQEGIV